MARALRPVLLVPIGLPGAGKSTLARALCRRRGWVRVDRDALQRRHSKGAATAAVWRAAAAALARGRSVVLDGMTFASEAQRRRARALARASGARCVELFLDCPPALARSRVAASASAHPARDRSPALVSRVARRFDPAPRRALRLDARRSAPALLRRVLRSV